MNLKRIKTKFLNLRQKKDKCIEESEDMSLLRFSISIFVRLQRKLRFPENGEELPRTAEVVRFSL